MLDIKFTILLMLLCKWIWQVNYSSYEKLLVQILYYITSSI